MKGIKSSETTATKSFQNEKSVTHFKTTVLPKINLQIINNKSVYDCHFKMSVILSLQSVNHSHINKDTHIKIIPVKQRSVPKRGRPLIFVNKLYRGLLAGKS